MIREKIELNQSDVIVLLVEKIKFLTEEYENLHSAFTYDGRGRTQTDPIKIAESYQRFLLESGDIKRLLIIYDSFTKPIRKRKLKLVVDELPINENINNGIQR